MLQMEHVSVLANVVAFASLDKTHLSEQVKKLVAQLSKHISTGLQKLP